MSEMQTIEVRFPGERLGSYVDGLGTTWTLYRTPEDGYRIHADDGTLAWVGAGRYRNGLEDWEVRWICPGFTDLLSK